MSGAHATDDLDPGPVSARGEASGAGETGPGAQGGISPSCGDGGEALLEQVVSLVRGWKGRPSWDEYFMSTAFLIASRSPCDRLHVGCVLVSAGTHSNRIIAAGYNGFLPGSAHVSHVREGHEQATVHAEQNAISDAARRGISLEGATAYVTHYPCINCAKIMAAAGIRMVKYHSDYKNDALVREMLDEQGIRIEHL